MSKLFALYNSDKGLYLEDMHMEKHVLDPTGLVTLTLVQINSESFQLDDKDTQKNCYWKRTGITLDIRGLNNKMIMCFFWSSNNPTCEYGLDPSPLNGSIKGADKYKIILG